jgi:hypothetical protein
MKIVFVQNFLPPPQAAEDFLHNLKTFRTAPYFLYNLWYKDDTSLFCMVGIVLFFMEYQDDGQKILEFEQFVQAFHAFCL